MENTTFAEVRALAAKQDQPLKDSNLKTITYLENLATATGKPLKQWPIGPFLNPARIRSNALDLLTDRNDLNRVFFTFDDSSFKPEPHEFLKSLDERANDYLKDREHEIMRDITSIRESISDLYSSIETYEARLFDRQQLLSEEMRKKKPTIRGQIEKALNALPEFYRTEKTNGRWVYFRTKPVVLGAKNPASGEDYSLPFGSFQVAINIFTRETIVFGHHGFAVPDRYGDDDNEESEDCYYHPYIGYLGAPCYGNLKAIFLTARKNADFLTILQITEKLLTTYSPDTNPHRTLSDFRDRYNDVIGDAPKYGHSFDWNSEGQSDDTDESTDDAPDAEPVVQELVDAEPANREVTYDLPF